MMCCYDPQDTPRYPLWRRALSRDSAGWQAWLGAVIGLAFGIGLCLWVLR